MRRTAIGLYAATLLCGFASLYAATRSSLLIGDGAAFVTLAQRGDAAELHYGEPGHLLQVPAARLLWLMLERLGLPVSAEGVFVAISIAGTLAAIVFVGLIAAGLLQTPAAAWLAAILFGTSLNVWTQSNGELYGLALGFVTAGLYAARRNRVVAAGVLWSLSVLSHSEFALAAPAFIAAAWTAQPDTAPRGDRVRAIATLLVLAGSSTAVLLLAGSWAIGKWTDPASLAGWFHRSFAAREQDLFGRPEVTRAIKGLLTAFTVAGHYWRDILTGRGQYNAPWFGPAAVAGLLVLAGTGVLLAASLRQRRLALFALAWLLPFHVLVNWWFVPTVEKYHAGALPGFVLLVTAGLITVGARMTARGRYLLYGSYVAACVGLNLFGAVLPMQRLGRDIATGQREIRLLIDEREGKPVFISCDDPRVLVSNGVEFLRLRSIWVGTVPDIQQRIVDWTSARLSEGREPYLVGRWCLPEEWKTTASKQPFDLFFVERSFKLVPTGLADVPVSESVPTNPFNWTRGNIVRLESKAGS